jgi:hypothetical protein
MTVDDSMTDLDYARLDATPVATDPFAHVVIPDFVPADRLRAVVTDLPPLAKRGSFPPDSVRMGPAARMLMEEMEGPRLRTAIADKFGLDLHDAPTMVTLRGDRMYEFLDRLMNVALPRVRDFRGVSPKAFDGRGNYTLGVKDQLIFPEIDYSKVEKTKGMNICITTTARTDAEGAALLRQMGMPFRQ